MNEDEDEDTQPERPRPRPTSVSAVVDLEQRLNAPAEFAVGSRPALEIDEVSRVGPAPSPREPFVVTCDLGGKHFAVETDGVAVSLVLLKAMRIVATREEAARGRTHPAVTEVYGCLTPTKGPRCGTPR